MLHLADFLIRHGQVALPTQVAGFCLSQPFPNRETVEVGLQSLRQIPLRLLHVADPVIRHGQIALPARVAGFCLCQPFHNHQPVAVGLQRLSQIPLRLLHVANLAKGYK